LAPQTPEPDNSHSGHRALERDDKIPGPRLRLERGGPALVPVLRVVARRQRVAVKGVLDVHRRPPWLNGPARPERGRCPPQRRVRRCTWYPWRRRTNGDRF